METVIIEEKASIAIVRLNHGVTNPVGTQLVDDLSTALKRVQQEATGMVLAGGEKFFSIGLNLPELLLLSRKDMAAFWDRFIQVTFDLYTLPMVTVAAVCGHAPAAGTVFALACDFRVVAEGRKVMGLTEITINIPVPYLPDLILRQVVGDRMATDLLYRGLTLNPEEALKVRLIDETMPQEKVLNRAFERASEIAAYSIDAFKVMKDTRTEDIRRKYHERAHRQQEDFLNCWHQESTQRILAKAAEKF